MATLAEYNYVWVPIDRSFELDADRAYNWISQLLGIDYGFPVVLTGWIDTIQDNFPCMKDSVNFSLTRTDKQKRISVSQESSSNYCSTTWTANCRHWRSSGPRPWTTEWTSPTLLSTKSITRQNSQELRTQSWPLCPNRTLGSTTPLGTGSKLWAESWFATSSSAMSSEKQALLRFKLFIKEIRRCWVQLQRILLVRFIQIKYFPVWLPKTVTMCGGWLWKPSLPTRR